MSHGEEMARSVLSQVYRKPRPREDEQDGAYREWCRLHDKKSGGADGGNSRQDRSR